MPVRHNVVLIGFMGTGKTAVGRALAARLGLAFVDTDAVVEERAGRPVARIFAEDGEERFRRLESEAVASAGDREGAVIATGGGVVLRPENMARLRRRGMVVALRAAPEAIVARVGAGADRPLLGDHPEERVRRLLEERGPLYQDADLVVDTSNLSADEIARCIEAFAMTWKGAAPSGPSAATAVPVETVRVDVGPRGYEVRIGTGLLRGIGADLRRCGMAGKIAVLTHPRLRALYGGALVASLEGEGYEVATVEVAPSEASKSLRVATRVYDALLDARLDRASALVVLGGGVAGDLGGFVAATFLRGIAWAAVPTTLLGQVDAAIGGKTAVNHPRGKNLIGAVYQPALVVADIDTLALAAAARGAVRDGGSDQDRGHRRARSVRVPGGARCARCCGGGPTRSRGSSRGAPRTRRRSSPATSARRPGASCSTTAIRSATASRPRRGTAG